MEEALSIIMFGSVMGFYIIRLPCFLMNFGLKIGGMGFARLDLAFILFIGFGGASNIPLQAVHLPLMVCMIIGAAAGLGLVYLRICLKKNRGEEQWKKS
jgi:hypothetical protein